MTTRVTDDRQAFEAWAVSMREPTGRYNSDPEQYADSHVQFMWRGWQAALRSQGKVADLAENRGLQTGLALGWKLGQDNDTETFNSVSATYEREAREMRQEQCPTANTGKVVSVEKLKALQPYWCDWNDQALDEETDPEGSLKRFPKMSIVYKYEDLTAIIGEGD